MPSPSTVFNALSVLLIVLTAIVLVDHFITAQAVSHALSGQPAGTCINVENFNVCN